MTREQVLHDLSLRLDKVPHELESDGMRTVEVPVMLVIAIMALLNEQSTKNSAETK